MKELWWEEAAKYQVLPLNNQPGRFGDRPLPARALRVLPGDRSAARGGGAEPARPRASSWRRRSTCPPTGAVDGTIVAHGGHSGGYAVYLQGRRLHYAYNFLGTEITVVAAEVELPGGERRGARSCVTQGEAGDGYDVALSYGDVPVGAGHIPRRTPVTYGMSGFAVGYQPGGVDLPRPRRAAPRSRPACSARS